MAETTVVESEDASHRNHKIDPPTVKHDDVHISYERLREAHSRNWPPRKGLKVPEYVADAQVEDVVDGLRS